MKKIWVAIGIVVILALLGGCGGGGGGSIGGGTGGGGGSTTTSIEGYVVDASTNMGIKGATVELISAKNRQSTRAVVQTGDNGYFRIDADAGKYTLRVELPNGDYQAVELVIEAYGQVNIVIRMVKREITIANVKITAPPPDGPNGTYLVGNKYRFTATAEDSNGNPITDIRPTWYVTPTDIGTIDNDGNFTPQKAGTCTVWAVFTADKKDSVVVNVTKLGLTVDELQRCFPLSQGSQWTYSSKIDKSFTIMGKTESSSDNPTYTYFINGTYSGPEFPITVVVREVKNEIREYWTNDNGEVKEWGEQYYNQDEQKWGPIIAFQKPLLWIKANAASWRLGAREIDISYSNGELDISIVMDVSLSQSMEKVRVPAGNFTCYRLDIKPVSVDVKCFYVDWQRVTVKSSNISFTINMWLAPGVGIVKSVSQLQGSVEFEDNTGKTGTATFSQSEVDQLTGYIVK